MRSQRPESVSCLGLIDLLVGLLEHRDPFFRGSGSLTRRLACAIGEELALEPRQLDDLALAALLRDLGRIAVGGRIVERPRAELTADEREKVERHILTGMELLEGITLPDGVAEAVRHHHERWDGKGYPDGLQGREISLLARILAVADAYAAMISPRPYRPPLRASAALEEVMQDADRCYDPEVVTALVRVLTARNGHSPDFDLRSQVVLIHPAHQRSTVISARLSSHGYVVEVVSDLAAARERLRRVPVVALLLTAAMDGVTAALTALRDEPGSRELPIIALDADTSEARVALMEAGADLCLPSDASVREIRAALTALRGRARRGEEGSRESPDETGGAEAGTSQPWYSLNGSLEDFELSWLLQVLQYDARTGVVMITSAGYEGVIFVESGDPYHARTPTAEGDDAFRELLAMRAGRFTVHPGVRTDERTIETSLMELLLDAAVCEDHAAIFGAVEAA